MKANLTLFILLIPFFLHAQGVSPTDWGLRGFEIDHHELGQINYFISEKGIEEDKPVMFLYSGCAGLPTMLVVNHSGNFYQLGTVPPDQLNYFTDNYHVVFLGRAGTPFCDTTEVEEFNPMRNLENYKPSDEYILKCGIEWEVEAMSVVLDRVLAELTNSKQMVVALGISEGGRIVARFALADPRITHIACVVSGGLNQFYSSIINRRLDAASGKISHEEAQLAIDKLFATYREVYADAESTEKWYYGHPYKRWGSYCNDIPLENLLKLDIPICLLNGSADRSSPILQSDYVMLEFIRHGKTNLTYFALPGVNHQFYRIGIDEHGEEYGISMRQEVFGLIDTWLSEKML